MRFDRRRLLSWLLPKSASLARLEIWKLPFVQGNLKSMGSLHSALNELIKKGFIKEEGGKIQKTPKGIQKTEEINKKKNC